MIAVFLAQCLTCKTGNFFLETPLGKAVLQYENEGQNTMNMYHTGVPTEYRGQGIAGHLAKVSLHRGNHFTFLRGICTLQILFLFLPEWKYHIIVPFLVAKELVFFPLQAALDYAVVQDAKVKLTCTYLQKYVKDNPSPEYTSRVV